MKKLITGYMRFKENVLPKEQDFFSKLGQAQHPEALFITCADSRIVPDLITQTRPGELFMSRTVGNQVPPYHSRSDNAVASSIEYALGALNVRHIIICGHSDCGAMKAVLHPEKLVTFPSTAAWLSNPTTAHWAAVSGSSGMEENELLRLVSEQNIVRQIENLKTHPQVASRLAKGEVEIHGWFYEIHSGEVSALDALTGSFEPLAPVTMAAATAAA